MDMKIFKKFFTSVSLSANSCFMPMAPFHLMLRRGIGPVPAVHPRPITFRLKRPQNANFASQTKWPNTYHPNKIQLI
jgi:hypothetical protein